MVKFVELSFRVIYTKYRQCFPEVCGVTVTSEDDGIHDVDFCRD